MEMDAGGDINFREVRARDASFPQKFPEWSGQDVLPTSLNETKSEYVVNKLNKVRVWPIGLHGLVKKFRSFLRVVTGHMFFENLMTVCVLLNTFAMSLDRYGLETE